jgi:hypothetical protein
MIYFFIINLFLLYFQFDKLYNFEIHLISSSSIDLFKISIALFKNVEYIIL